MGDVEQFRKPDVLGTIQIDLCTRNGEIEYVRSGDGLSHEETRDLLARALWSFSRKVEGDEELVALIRIFEDGMVRTISDFTGVKAEERKAWLRRKLDVAERLIEEAEDA